MILAKLQERSAKQQLASWAKQIGRQEQLKIPGVDSNEWICPMLCVKPSHKAGRCPVCEMELVARSTNPPFEDWQLKFTVIQAFRDLGEKTASHARVIVASDAVSFTRMQAAELWAKEEPTIALPHLKLFLHSRNRDVAISMLANVAPNQSVSDFEKILTNSTTSFTKFEAWRGLLRAGNSKYLTDVRELVDQRVSSDSDKAQKAHAIYLLGQFGDDTDDLSRLKKLLDTEFKLLAAEALMYALKRKQ